MESHLVISSGRKEALMKPSNIYLSRSCSRPSCILAELCRLRRHVTRRLHGTSHPSRKLLLSILPQLTSKTALFWIQRPSGLGAAIPPASSAGTVPCTASAWQPSGGALRTLLGCQYQPLFKNRQRWNAKCLLHTVQGHALLTSTVTEMTTTRTCWCFGSRIPLRLDAHPSLPPHPLPHLTSGTRAGCLAAEIPPAIGWAGVDAIQLNA